MNTLLTPTLLDKHGFVKDHTVWTKELALALAESEGIALTEAHWEIIELLRAYYEAFDASPANRSLVNYTKINLGPEKGNSIYLMSLFPGSPARLASRIAGLPKPKNCL